MHRKAARDSWATLAVFLLLIAGITFVAVRNISATIDSTAPSATIEVLEARGVLDAPLAAGIADTIEFAQRNGSQAVLLDIDLRGALSVGLPAVGAITEAQIPVVVYIPEGARAAGGAAYLAAAAHFLVMAPDAKLGPAVPFELAEGEPGTVDPSRDGLSDYTSLRYLLPPPDIKARLLGDELARHALDAETARLHGLTAAAASTREEALAGLDGRAALTAAGLRQLWIEPGGTALRFHELSTIRRALRFSLLPATAFFLMLLTVVALLLAVRVPGLALLAAGLLAPFTIFGAATLPNRWWAIALITTGPLFVAIDIAVVWLGIPSLVGTLFIAGGGWWLTQGAPSLRVPWWALLLAVVTTSTLSLLAYRRSKQTVALYSSILE